MKLTNDELELLRHDLYSIANQLSTYIQRTHNSQVVNSMQEVRYAVVHLINDLKSQEID